MACVCMLLTSSLSGHRWCYLVVGGGGGDDGLYSFGQVCFRILTLTLISNFSVGERQIAVLDHVLDLPLHGDQKERHKVHDENGPEDGYVKDGKERAHKRDD